MDNKVIAMVGAVIVVGAAVYGVATGTVLPGTGEITENPPEDEPSDNGNTDTNTDNGGDNEDEESGPEDTATGNNSDGDPLDDFNVTDTSEQTVEEDTNYICEEQGGNPDVDRDTVPVHVGPHFDALLFESMLHDNFNQLRQVRSDADLLDCSPELREIAREHSRLRVEGGKINATSVRYEGVCENPRERYGRWYYQRDMELNSPGKSNDQRVVVIMDHRELVHDVRGVWVNRAGLVGTLTNEEYTRQGVGAHIDRRTREVIVTHVVCGDGTVAG